MVRGKRLPRQAQALGVAVALLAAAASCSERKAVTPQAMAEIVASEPSRRARALRSEVEALFRAEKYDEAASKAEAIVKAVGDILTIMEPLHHQKTAVPNFDVIRYVESLRDVGENLRGFTRLYLRTNPAPLKREMIAGLLEQLRKIR